MCVCLEENTTGNRHMQVFLLELKALNSDDLGTGLSGHVAVWKFNDVTSLNSGWNFKAEVDGLIDVSRRHGECGGFSFLCFFLCLWVFL